MTVTVRGLGKTLLFGLNIIQLPRLLAGQTPEMRPMSHPRGMPEAVMRPVSLEASAELEPSSL